MNLAQQRIDDLNEVISQLQDNNDKDNLWGPEILAIREAIKHIESHASCQHKNTSIEYTGFDSLDSELIEAFFVEVCEGCGARLSKERRSFKVCEVVKQEGEE